MKLLKNLISKILGTQTAEAAEQVSANPLEAGSTALQQQPVANPVDIDKVLTEMASKSSVKLNWRESIVDLMKLVGMDSGLAERKELAKELGYTGDTSDTAKMNIWLHKQVMQKLADNGGVVPADLLD